MQHRYVGDLGDFGKYGLLRCLCLPVRTVEDQTLTPLLGWPTVVDNHEGQRQCRRVDDSPLAV